MTLTVRRATIDDATAIAGVHVSAWQTAYKGLIPQDHLDRLAVEDRADQWRSLVAGQADTHGVPTPVTFVAEAGGDVVGFACVGRYRGEPDQTSWGELWALYVEPRSWGTGAGDVLMEQTLDELEHLGSSKAFLWVLAGNARARRFYERHGWAAGPEQKTFEISGTEISEIRYFRPVDS